MVKHLKTTSESLEEKWLKGICSQYPLLVLKKLYIFSTKHLEDWILALFQLLITMSKNIVAAIDTVIVAKSLCH